MRKQTKLSVMLASVALLIVSVVSIAQARGWVQQGGNWYYEKSDGEFATDEIQTSGTSKFYLGEDGTMQTDYFLEDYGDGNNTYYFGSNGAMVTNTWVAIDPSIVSNQGDVVPDVYWYYFGATGKANKASSGATEGLKKTTIDGKKYAFNEYGQMLTGWIDGSGSVIDPDDDDPYQNAVYYAGDDNDGQLHSGWLTYLDGSTLSDFEDKNIIYFYFNPTNNRKMGMSAGGAADTDSGYSYKTKKINGRTYAFDGTSGIMLSEWDAYDATVTASRIYFSAEDDGHQVKKGWVYTVPDESIDSDSYNDDEEEYMYFLNSGIIVQDQIKKINGKYYAFNKNGVMKTGLVFFNNDGTFGKKIKYDETDGGKFSKEGKFNTTDSDGEFTITLDADGDLVLSSSNQKGKIHLFGEDGARKTGTNNVTFADDEYSFGSNNNGNYQGVYKKKYYSLGILLKASTDLRYGMIVASTSESLKQQTWGNSSPAFWVVGTAGSKVNSSKTSKKDADGNYWLIYGDGDNLRAIYTVEVKYGTLTNVNKNAATWSVENDETASNETLYTGFLYKADSYSDRGGIFGTDTTKSYNNKWLPFGVADDTGKTCSITKGNGGYQVTPTNDYALNFIFN